MTRILAALGAAALAAVLVAATFDTAEARRSGGGGGFRMGGGGAHFSGRSFGGGPRFVGRPFVGGRAYYGGHRHHHHHHRHVRRGFVIGVPLAYGAYAYGGYGSCRWLRYRALETGSRYWWSRYYDCINGYY